MLSVYAMPMSDWSTRPPRRDRKVSRMWHWPKPTDERRAVCGRPLPADAEEAPLVTIAGELRWGSHPGDPLCKRCIAIMRQNSVG